MGGARCHGCRLGADWKRPRPSGTTIRFNTQGSVYANAKNWTSTRHTGTRRRPLIRLTYNGTDNDHRDARFLVCSGIIKA
jgi:hypothetical protein